jgi:mono/diheme cytochrome c family protein
MVPEQIPNVESDWQKFRQERRMTKAVSTCYFRLLGSVALLFVLVPALQGADESTASQVRRGSYLANRASLCGDCHTPPDDKGQPDKSRLYQGAPLGFTPKQPVPGWVDAAPPLAGLAGWTDGAAIKFLETGIGPNGKPANPPMPEYRFSRSDAEALVAYLRSLKGAKAATK